MNTLLSNPFPKRGTVQPNKNTNLKLCDHRLNAHFIAIENVFEIQNTTLNGNTEKFDI